jgi:hypothetical protein
MMELMRSQLRALLEEGIAYALRHPEDGRVVEQLRHLGLTLAAEAKVAEGIVGEPRPEPGPYVAVIVDRTRRWTANSMPHAPALAPSARQPDRHRGSQ